MASFANLPVLPALPPPDTTTQEVRLSGADDWHHHLRDGDVLPFTTSCAASQFRRAIVMPNLRPPVTTAALALEYRSRILAALPTDAPPFEPLMVMYLTDRTTPQDVADAAASGVVKALKLYPAGATTNSDSGVTDLAALKPTLEAMQAHGLLLLVHGEVTTDAVDIFDREAVFLETVLAPLLAQLPNLKVVLEHCTTAQGVAFVQKQGPNVAATITAHHLLYNRNALLVGGIKPHLYCLPVLKGEEHRRALLLAVASGSPKFFLGTDSAPHPVGSKHTGCGCAGVFTAHAALALYAEAFASVGALDKLEGFCATHGAAFYNLPPAPWAGGRKPVVLRRVATPVPASFPFGAAGELVPLRAGGTVAWAVGE